jgi:hypothetical protein
MQFNPLIDDKILNNIDKNFQIIPDSIKTKIYSEHYEPILNGKKLGDDLIVKLKSHNSCNLNIVDICPILTIVLDNKYAIDYLIENYLYIDEHTGKKYNYFKILYNQIIINNKKNFINISSDIEDFALSWLMYLYH